jgi:hypothetical protein
METYDMIGRKSGNFPVTEKEQKQFDDRMRYMHARIMGQV